MVEFGKDAEKFVIGRFRNTIAHRRNIPVALNWAEKENYQLSSLLTAFDDNIHIFNSFSSSNCPSILHNTTELRKTIGSQDLPTISTLLKVCDKNPEGNELRKHFAKALERMNRMMEEGDFATTPNHEFYLKYHTTTTDPLLLTVGTIYHFYEELMKVHHLEFSKCYDQGLIRPDLIVDALLETLMYKTYVERKNIGESQKLIEPLVNGLDWVRGYKRFAPEILDKIPSNQ